MNGFKLWGESLISKKSQPKLSNFEELISRFPAATTLWPAACKALIKPDLKFTKFQPELATIRRVLGVDGDSIREFEGI